MTERKPCKKLQDYNWTPLNAPLKEVLMEIKKDPMYWKPFPIYENPPKRTAHKYCAYHESHSHGTNTYVALMKLIEQFIASGKLTHFLAEQRGQQNTP